MKLTTALVLTALMIMAGCESSQPRTEVQNHAMAQGKPASEPEQPKPPKPPRPPERTGNVTVTVERILISRQDMPNLDPAWKFTKTASAEVNELAQRNGIRLGIASDRFSANLQTALAKVQRKGLQKTTLTVEAGGTGTANVGQGAQVEKLQCWTPQGDKALLEKATVASAIVVQAAVLPEDKVQLKVYPRFTASDGRTVDAKDLTLDVAVLNRQPLVLSSQDDSADKAGSALLTWTQAYDRRTIIVIITPLIQGAL